MCVTHHIPTGRGANLDGTAAFETDLEVAHDRARNLQRQARAHRSLGQARIRGREYLFGRHVRDVLDTLAEVVERRLPDTIRDGGRWSGGPRFRGSAAGGSGVRSAPRRVLSQLCRCGCARRRRGRVRRAAPRWRLAVQRRSTSGSPKTVRAQPSFGKAVDRPVGQAVGELAGEACAQLRACAPGRRGRRRGRSKSSRLLLRPRSR